MMYVYIRTLRASCQLHFISEYRPKEMISPLP